MSDLTAPEAQPDPQPQQEAPATEQQTSPPPGQETPPSQRQVEDDLYPTDFQSEQPRKVVHETVYNGRRVALTADDIDRVTHYALTQEAERLKREREQAQQKAQDAPTQQKTDEANAEVARLNKELEDLKLQFQTQQNETQVKTRTDEMLRNLNSEIDSQKVFKDHPDARDYGMKLAMALMSADTSLTEKQAVQQVAAMQGKLLNQVKEKYVKDKITDASESEALPGGGDVATPGPKPATGRDLMRGKVRDQVMRRLMQASVT